MLQPTVSPGDAELAARLHAGESSRALPCTGQLSTRQVARGCRTHGHEENAGAKAPPTAGGLRLAALRLHKRGQGQRSSTSVRVLSGSPATPLHACRCRPGGRRQGLRSHAHLSAPGPVRRPAAAVLSVQLAARVGRLGRWICSRPGQQPRSLGVARHCSKGSESMQQRGNRCRQLSHAAAWQPSAL